MRLFLEGFYDIPCIVYSLNIKKIIIEIKDVYNGLFITSNLLNVLYCKNTVK